MTNLKMRELRKGISYVRFSTLAQGAEGRNSTQRQKDALAAALQKWNLELDATFSDKGKSGYHQKHIAKGGAMFELRNRALKGELKGKVLVVEDFDRAGRMQVTDAAPLLLDMLNNGVDLVVGQYGGEYFSKDIVNANPYLLYRALDDMNRGFGESKRKTELAKAKWKARREAVANGKSVALNSLPFWLVNEKDHEGKCTGNFLVKDGMAELIKEVYALYLGGEGSQVIANKLTARKVSLPLRRNGEVRSNANVWHSNFIQRLIKNRALLGYYHGTEHKVFPRLIDEADFYRANQTMKGRVRFAGRRTEHVNPYSGLCYCAHCDGRFSRHGSRPTRAKKDYVYLQCRSSKLGKCTAAGIQYQRFEESFMNFLPQVDFPHLKQNSDEVFQTDEIKAKIAQTERQIAKLKTAIEAMEDPAKAVSLATMLTNYDMQHAQLVKDLEAETIREKGTTSLNVAHYKYLRSLFRDETKLQEPATRREIQEALRVSIDRITIDVKTQSYTVAWKNSPEVFKVELQSGGYKTTGEGGLEIQTIHGDALDLPRAA